MPMEETSATIRADRCAASGGPLLAALLALWTAAPAQEAAVQRAGDPELAALVRGYCEAEGERTDIRQLIANRGAAVVPALVAKARAEQDPKRQAAIIRLIGELELGADAAAPALMEFIDDGKRPKLEVGKAVSGFADRPGQAAAVALGRLAPYATRRRDEIRTCLVTEMRTRYGFHIAPIRAGYFRSLVDGGAAIGTLVVQLEDPIPYVREAAADALGRRGRDAREALDALAGAMAAEHPQKIKVALDGWSGSSSADWDGAIRAAAARAMVRIAPADKRSGAALVKVVESEDDPALLLVAVRHLGLQGKAARPALERLCQLVTHRDARLAGESVTAIGMIGVFDDAVERALVHASERTQQAVALRAAATLRALRPAEKKKAP